MSRARWANGSTLGTGEAPLKLTPSLQHRYASGGIEWVRDGAWSSGFPAGEAHGLL